MLLWLGGHAQRKPSIRTHYETVVPPTASKPYRHVADLSRGRGGTRVWSQGQSLGQGLCRPSPCLALVEGAAFTCTFVRSPARLQRSLLALRQRGNVNTFQTRPAAGVLGNRAFSGSFLAQVSGSVAFGSRRCSSERGAEKGASFSLGRPQLGFPSAFPSPGTGLCASRGHGVHLGPDPLARP